MADGGNANGKASRILIEATIPRQGCQSYDTIYIK